MEKGAKICGQYVYNIWCKWSNERPCVFVMLNPSTSDKTHDNPTIRNCITIARDKNCGGMIAVDLFACVAGDEAKLLEKKSEMQCIIGPKNDFCLRSALSKPNALIIAAWGNVSDRKEDLFRKTKEFNDREHYISEMIREIAKNKNPDDIKRLKGTNNWRGQKREGQTDHPLWFLDYDYREKSNEENAKKVIENYYLADFPL